MIRKFLMAVIPMLVIGMTVPSNSAQAQTGYVSTYALGYVGTSTRYTSLADALANVNGVSSAIPQRDLALYLVDNNLAFGGSYANSAIIQTNWFSDASQGYSGIGNPSNTNAGFNQMYDLNGNTITSMDMFWANAARTSFTFSATGVGSTSSCADITVDDCSRFGSGTGTGGGSFLQWAVSLTATGLAPAVFNSTTGAWESSSNPTGVTGWITGLFQNTSVSTPADNGWYWINESINQTSFAASNNWLNPLDGAIYGASETRADDVVPEPATMTLLATGLAGMAAAQKRKKKAQQV